MKRFLTLLFVIFLSFDIFAQKIYLGADRYESNVIANVINGYVYLGKSNMQSDLICYFDGKYLYILNDSKTPLRSNILMTWSNNKIYEGNLTMEYKVLANLNGKKIYNKNSSMTSDIIFTYKDNTIYKGNSNMRSDALLSTSGYVHPIILCFILMI